MGLTLAEKILARVLKLSSISPGEVVWAPVDLMMMQDMLGPLFLDKAVKELGDKISDPGKVVMVADHYPPFANIKQADIGAFTRHWVEEYGIDNYHELEGTCHQLLAENYILPEMVVVGTDSHTCMGGALGAFATGVGSTEMAAIMVTGKVWLTIPQSIKVEMRGRLMPGVQAKDAILRIIKGLGHDGAEYKALEFQGEALQTLSMDDRLTMTNMAVEAGAKVGLFPVDEITKEFLRQERDLKWNANLEPDKDASYTGETIVLQLDELSPQVSIPHNVDQVVEMAELPDVEINQAYIGSCTGGRLTDLASAAMILNGKKVAKGVRLLVSPASAKVWLKASKEGILTKLSEAGATILPSMCGACVGAHSGILASGEVCISSTNRNFKGRMGSSEASIYLGSPLTVAASAISGKIVDPRDFL